MLVIATVAPTALCILETKGVGRLSTALSARSSEARAHDHLTSLGLRGARERITRLFLEIYVRVRRRLPAERETLGNFAATGATLAIHLSIHALKDIVSELTPFYGRSCPAAVVARASWPDERIVRATLGEIVGALRDTPIERTALILVGPALGAEDFRDSELYNADYVRRFRGGRSPEQGE